MRFDRYPRVSRATASPQRMAAARKAVERDREKCGLFPEMMQFQTPEQRVEAILDARVTNWQEMRNLQARSWKEARRRLKALPPITRSGVLRYWQTGPYPGSACYLASMVWDAEHGRSFWAVLAQRRRLQLIGAGKMPAPWKVSPTKH